MAGLLGGLDPAGSFPAIEHRQAEIHEDHVGLLADREFYATGTVARDHYGVALTLEAALKHVDVVLIVFDIQNLHARTPFTLACWPRSIESGSMRPNSRSSSFSSEALFRMTRSTLPLSRRWSSTLRSLAVRTSTGMSRHSACRRISIRNSKPSISGISRSSTMTSGDEVVRCWSARRPLLAPATSHCSCSSTRRTLSRMISSSSTNSTRRPAE